MARKVATTSERSSDGAPLKAGWLIHDTSRLRRIVFDQRFRRMDITRSQWWVLSNVERYHGDEGFTQIELARLLDVGRVALGSTIDLLEKKGLVAREADQLDRRVNRIRVTAKGAEVLRKLEVVARAVNDEVMQGIPPRDEEILVRSLAMMKRNLKALYSASLDPENDGLI